MERENFEEDYEFEVEHHEYGYSVYLPHQCDEWEIVGADYKLPKSKELAVSQMELFVKRAQEALEKLKQLD